MSALEKTMVDRLTGIMRIYGVRFVYRSARDGTGLNYAVFCNGHQVSDTKAHLRAIEDRDQAIAEHIIAELKL